MDRITRIARSDAYRMQLMETGTLTFMVLPGEDVGNWVDAIRYIASDVGMDDLVLITLVYSDGHLPTLMVKVPE